MIKIRRTKERGFSDRGWLQTYHTFSFHTYHDPHYTHYRSLRVMNESFLKGGKSLGMQEHKEIEIITYVLQGVLEYRDNQGKTCVLRPGEIYHISAGNGIYHDESNLSHNMEVHFLQMWIQPEQFSLEPSSSHRLFSSVSKYGQWCLLLSKNGREDSLKIHQDVDIYATILDEKDGIVFETREERYYWIQVVSGKFLVQENFMELGDGASFQAEDSLQIQCLAEGELLLFDFA